MRPRILMTRVEGNVITPFSIRRCPCGALCVALTFGTVTDCDKCVAVTLGSNDTRA